MRQAYLICSDYLKPLDTTKLMIASFAKRGYRVRMLDPHKLEYSLSAKKIEIFHGKERISDAKLLIIRGTRVAPTDIYNLAVAFERLGAVVLDPSHALGSAGAKFAPHLDRVGKISFPASVFLPSISGNSFKRITSSGIKAPFIVKPQNGHHGEGVELIKNANDLAIYATNYPNTPIIAQPFLDIIHEYRVLLLGKKSLGVCEKRSESIVKNAAQGGSFTYLRDKRVEAFARKAVTGAPSHFYGVDVAETKNGSLYVLEANRAPAFDAFRKASKLPIEDYFADYCLTVLKRRQKA